MGSNNIIEFLQQKIAELESIIEQMKPLEIGETVYYKDKAGNITEAKIAFVRDQYIELDNDILMPVKSLHRNREDLRHATNVAFKNTAPQGENND